MTADGVYKLVQAYAHKIELTGIERLGVHALRATAATNALQHEADIARWREDTWPALKRGPRPSSKRSSS
jgi:integrase/recombinase XerD